MLLWPCISLFAQEETLLTKAVLFSNGGEASLLIRTQEEWHSLGLAELSLRGSSQEKRGENGRYRLRFRLQVENASNADMSMVQLRFLQGDRISLFNLELETRDIHDTLLYTNWYEPPESFSSENWRGPVSIRILSAPGRTTELEIDAVELELWGTRDNTSTSPQVVLADSGSFVRPSVESPNIRQDENIPTLNEVQDFSLKFISSVIHGDLPEFYATLAEDIYSLNTGHSYSRYRIPPPEGLSIPYSLEQYQEEFNLKIYNYDQFINLFPQWKEQNRNWNPGKDTFLVLGNQKLSTRESPFSDKDLLVFMVASIKGELKIVARPEF